MTINDNEGAANSTTSQTFVATVVVPVVQAVPTQTVDEGSTLTLAGATFVDADPSGAYTALINWGDGSSSMGVIAVDTTQVAGQHVHDQRHARLWRCQSSRRAL